MDNFKHKKSLGQNFLKDKGILSKIKNSVDVNSDDLIIEIGPGQGALTKYLKEFGTQILCFEIDERVKPYLDQIEDDLTKVIYGDFLRVNIKEMLKEYKYNNIYVIANLPYYITTPIITSIIDSGVDVKEMVFMVQDEVANRFTSNPGVKDYGSITVYFNYYFDIEKLFIVNRKCFDPVPGVDSAVIKFKEKLSPIKSNNEELFFKLVKNSFMHKRKNIRNNLYMYDLEKINEVLMRHGFDLTCRAEQLSLEIFVDISNSL